MKVRRTQNLIQTPSATISLTTRQSLYSITMGTLLLAMLVAGVVEESAKVKVYHFTPTADHYYENPKNWSPEYPGKVIPQHQKIIIQGAVYSTYESITVRGEVEITPGSSLYSFSDNLIIETQGAVHNRGKIVVKEIENYGILNNEMTGSIDILHFHAFKGSKTHNLHTSSLTVAGSLMNQGEIFNYSDFLVHDQFSNYAHFHHGANGKLTVNGKEVKGTKAPKLYSPITENHPQVLQ
ncbi:MAG: hypothetical protein AAFR66_17815 [Bacteroidota bacterium]